MSLRHMFVNMGKIGHRSEKVSDHRATLIAVSIEDRFYYAIKCGDIYGHSIHANYELQETRIPERLKVSKCWILKAQ